ncbi:MAG: CoA-binding protein [Zetaproteobacteria bacterium CG12_big_fil_rev_8_21_14_0_65_54_13]|nr:MAG: CoA-binding protein [Zetaproteobacteria bacterium CG23_combo_of_CG06-09_8_20_14_all_54_7]PIW51436.1 MAG: CoA-binding protein [Zetaproteobacteria bacterium CG12_big_fil_rev_8_21_14_0_65_54_13]PIX53227.1 MAG: CoA-binding protein [Zetaproteobacteria bacterium CG_4_10_14_3_um_filter_54_28]PJA30583.1 MAG: CoA-binding protein [Zetaproteobacteria bacterium CG_4_9_14_3_um_filter_54_145]
MSQWQNPNDAALAGLLRSANTIAVVGCSPKPERTSHRIAAFLLTCGYHVIPIHPKADMILGQKAYASLSDIPEPVDIVNLFLRPELTPPIARASVAIGAGALWLQQGIINEEAGRIATSGGQICVMDLCIAVMHRTLLD